MVPEFVSKALKLLKTRSVLGCVIMFDKDSELGTSIPDSALQVSEVFEESEWEEISRNVNIILREHNVLPLMHTLGPIDIQGCTRGGSGVEMPNGKALRSDRGAV